MSGQLVQVKIAGYKLPNGGTYRVNDLVALSAAEFAAIPGADVGGKVSAVSGNAGVTSYLVKVLTNNYKMSNGGTYQANDVVALSLTEMSAVPAADIGSHVSVQVSVGSGAYSASVSPTVVRSIPRLFLGIGMEVYDILRYSGQTFPVNALTALNIDGNNAPTLRLGGGSADGAWWNPSGTADPTGITYDYNAAYCTAVSSFLTATGMKVIVDLNFLYGSTSVASAWATAAIAGFPANSILAFQIGNEPDIYHSNSLAAYLSAMPAFVTAVEGVVGSTPLSLPVFATYAWLDPSQFAAMDTAFGSGHKVYDVHHYPLLASNSPGISNLLDPSYDTVNNTTLTTLLAHADAVGKTVRVSELNSVAQGGTAGVSNSHAAGLWMLRSLLEMAQIGVAAVNVHGIHGASYTPVEVSTSGNIWTIQAPYYGMMMFARAAQHDAQFLTVSNSLPSTLSLFALKGSDNVYRLVAVNMDDTNQCLIDVPLPTTKTGTTTLHTAADLSSTSGMTIAGQTWDGSTDGTPVGTKTTGTLSPTGSVYRLTVPAHSALLVEIAA